MFVHNQLEYMFDLIVTDCAMAGHWCDTTWLQRKYSIRLCGGFLLEYIYIYTGGTASRATKTIEHIHNLFEHTRDFPYLSN